MKTIIRSAMFAVALTFAATAALPVFADTSAQIQARMKERLPEIKKLKSEGKVGENNKGYLGYPSAKSADAEKTVTAENADRKQVYAAIAKQQGTSTDAVGERRAIQNAENAKSGEYVQKSDGTWEKKK